MFTLAIKLATKFFLGWLVGYMPPDPSGEGTMGMMPLWSAAHPWLLPNVTAVGGAVLAAEILYKHDLEVEAIIPALIASIIGYSVFSGWFGWNAIFATSGNLTFTSPVQLFYYILLLCGLIGLLYARGFYGITHRFHKLALPKWLKPAIGGLLVGLK